MPEPFDTDKRRAIRAAIARDLYARDALPIIDGNLTGHQWLVPTHRGLFALSLAGTKLIARGWFFGICREGEVIYLFENCAMRDREALLGRILRFDVKDDQILLRDVIAKGLHANCHQIRMIDGLLCVVDTGNQRILRFTPDGVPVDVKTPFAIAPATDRSGAYLHMNSVAKIRGRIAIMLHNGTALPPRPSELAWLDSDWQLIERQPLPGHKCHDIVEGETGTLWHCGSMAGELISSAGDAIKLSDLMTRALCFTAGHIVIGASPFGDREVRDGLRGTVTILDRGFERVAEFELGGPPADVVGLG